ncbi:MAG: hypothetical protein ACOYWZ_20165 [Bacillota bacterium]
MTPKEWIKEFQYMDIDGRKEAILLLFSYYDALLCGTLYEIGKCKCPDFLEAQKIKRG